MLQMLYQHHGQHLSGTVSVQPRSCYTPHDSWLIFHLKINITQLRFCASLWNETFLKTHLAILQVENNWGKQKKEEKWAENLLLIHGDMIKKPWNDHTFKVRQQVFLKQKKAERIYRKQYWAQLWNYIYSSSLSLKRPEYTR